MPEDVNNDGAVSASDALAIINAMSRREARDTRMFTDVNGDGQRSPIDALMVINRIGRDRGGPQPGGGNDGRGGDNGQGDNDQGDGGSQGPVDPPDQSVAEVQSIDGSGNNLDNPSFGAVDTNLLRVAEADYADGVSEPGGEDRPSARVISNLLSAADPEGTTNDRDLSAYLFIWGQFLDHDIDLSHAPDEESLQESFDIEVPTGDPLFDPFGTGEVTIPLTRSAIDPETGISVDNPAQQINSITAWIDGSQVYGSDEETAAALREFVGGRLLITDDGLLPTDENGDILAGDVRAAENIALTSMHALFVREHNRLADQIAAENPGLTDEEIYQQARSMVIAELQAITFNEFLPALLGEDAIGRYRGYDSSVDPSIANEFSTAAFRFGHSTLTDTLGFIGNDGQKVREDIALSEAFFRPALLEETGIDSILKYGASNVAQEIDLQVVDSLRNFLFGPPGAGGFDLVSLNIQRGRDHGLADFNATRVAYGLEAYESFDQITSDTELQANLESLYGDVNNIDLWVGLLAEDHARGASLGETAVAIIADQFRRLRDGDRFWYENQFQGRDLDRIENTSLADIIERNTNVSSLQDNVFLFRPTVSGEVTALAAAPAQAVLADSTDRRNDRRNRNNESRDPQPVPMEGMTVELLDAEGTVVDSTTTDERGRYRFDDFAATGTYQVRLADAVDVLGSEVLDVSISSGNTRVDAMDFAVMA